ncbi:hypothetical protein GCM10017044_04360 [Kordiimonas sediminis]|uniref:Uncharacterized protein n=1 Tax=Kordiimonas sediminis TaxID=1735581 RepID=A0A919E2P6_9PROT|nr:hypothetical protein [Kordiimonas sediminis]GHF13456.1 hypothetical protein GCM10017044_04360 [Kordiimonas sediminis]
MPDTNDLDLEKLTAAWEHDTAPDLDTLHRDILRRQRGSYRILIAELFIAAGGTLTGLYMVFSDVPAIGIVVMLFSLFAGWISLLVRRRFARVPTGTIASETAALVQSYRRYIDIQLMGGMVIAGALLFIAVLLYVRPAEQNDPMVFTASIGTISIALTLTLVKIRRGVNRLTGLLTLGQSVQNPEDS